MLIPQITKVLSILIVARQDAGSRASSEKYIVERPKTQLFVSEIIIISL